jgi:predicted RNase H-like nuclease (RuvC/YqgF family)
MQENVVFGIDIAKGSVRAKEEPRFAVVILKGDDVEHHRMVSRQKLLRMAWQEKPALIGVDNIFELASDKHELASILSKLPANTKLIQVTGGEDLLPLVKLAKQHDIFFDRFDPNAEALACARLAAMGIGYEVSAFEDKTIIKVSRARSPGRGGWSQNRYRRKMHGYVRQKAREIEDYLDEQSKSKGFTFTQNITERFGGYSKSEFFVDAPRSLVHIGSGKYGDVQVNVKSIERDALFFKPLKTRKRDYIIVGIDPGTTTAIAVVTLEGELRMLHSSRTISIPDVIEMIAEQGRPLIIASDVFPTPNAVEKIRRAFNAVSGSPEVIMTAGDKIELATPYGYSNNHERDAIAAAVSVYRKNKNKFEQIKKKIPHGMDPDEVIAQVVRGKAIDAAILEMTKKETKAPEAAQVPLIKEEESQHFRELIRKYEENIGEMKKYQDELKIELDTKDEELRKLGEFIEKQKSEAYKQFKKEKIIRVRDKEIAHLRKRLSENNKKISYLNERIHRLKHIRRLEISGRALPVKIISAFTKDSILKTQEEVGIKKDDILLLKDASGGGSVTAKMLFDMGVRAIIICNDMSHAAEEELFNLGMPVLNAKDVNIQFDPAGELAVINPEDIKNAIEGWNRRAEQRKTAAKEEWLRSLVDEYRSERRREVKG